MRLVADENCDFSLVIDLRAAGYDVASITELMAGADDRQSSISHCPKDGYCSRTTRITVSFSALGLMLETSGRWGRIKAEVVCSMTSKYAIALYELLQLRGNLDRCTETFQIDRFRELKGVPPETYARGDNACAKS